MDTSEITNILKNKADIKYKNFAQKLILHNVNMLGVRLPELRKIAKLLAKENSSDILQHKLPTNFFEEKMLLAMAIGYISCDLKSKLKSIAKFIPKIDNWSVCDSFCATLKFDEKDLPYVWDFLAQYFESYKEYPCRFAHVLTLNQFVNPQYLEKYLCKATEFKNKFYYAKMACAWALATYHAIFPEEINRYISTLQNAEIKNLAIKKILESRKTSEENRNILKAIQK